MAYCVTYVTEEHLMFVECTLTYLTMSIIPWGEKELAARGEGTGETEGCFKATLRLE